MATGKLPRRQKQPFYAEKKELNSLIKQYGNNPPALQKETARYQAANEAFIRKTLVPALRKQLAKLIRAAAPLSFYKEVADCLAASGEDSSPFAKAWKLAVKDCLYGKFQAAIIRNIFDRRTSAQKWRETVWAIVFSPESPKSFRRSLREKVDSEKRKDSFLLLPRGDKIEIDDKINCYFQREGGYA